MNLKDTENKEADKGLLKALSGFFGGYREKEKPEQQASFDDSPLTGLGGADYITSTNDPDEESESDTIQLRKMPRDRRSRYSVLNELRRVDLLKEAVNIHVTHALAPDSVTKKSFYLTATKPEHEKLVAELNAEVVSKINRDIMRWAKVTCEYGVSYVKPRYKVGVGITGFDFNFYTLPNFIRMYERDGSLAGFTNQHMRKKNQNGIELQPPWSMIPLKIPYYTPDPEEEPDNIAAGIYSLMNEDHQEIAMETQDYGESFLDGCYEAFLDFSEAVESLRASRVNASKRERLLLANLGKLGSVQGARWLDELARSIKSDDDWHEKRRKSNGLRSTIENKLIPMREGTTLQTEVQEVNPNIQHIEDIMFHLKRMIAATGLDYTMVGWADMMSGGLGEGGFLQTSIQAGRRASQLRVATEEFIERACRLHIYYKHKKALPEGQALPWEVVFNSMSATIKAAEEEERERKANRAAVVTSVVDAIQQGSTSKSRTLTKRILGDALDVSEDELNTILDELYAKEEGQDQDALMAALQDNPEATSLLLSQMISEVNS